MIHFRRSLFALVLGIVLFSTFSGYANAQNSAAPDKDEVAALREKAFKLLDLVAAQLNTLQSVENRVRIGSNLVESLWKHDEDRARSLLRVVQEDIKAEVQKPDRKLRDYERFSVFVKLRHDTIERVAKHDAEAAYDFLKVTEPTMDELTPYELRESEKTLEVRLAKQVAINNADVALKLGRQSLERGLSSQILTLLIRLNRKHKAHAQILYKEIVAKLRDADIVDDWHFRNIAQSLVQTFRPPDADESVYREFVGIFVTRALARGCGQKLSEENEHTLFCRWAATSISGAERYDPRAAGLKHWVTENFLTQNPLLAFQQVQELIEEGGLDQIEAVASRHPDLKTSLYIQSIHQLMLAGEFAQARKWVDRLSAESGMREQLLAQIERYEKRATVDEPKLVEIQKKLDEIPEVSGKVWFLLSQANQFGATDPKVALKFLNQANEIAETLGPGKMQMRARLFLALIYCFEKNDRGFTIMESLLPKLNELVDVAVKLDGFDTNYLRDGEWNMSANGSVGEILTLLSSQAGSFAWCDFDRAVSLASQFERPEIRLMAHLKLAQGILAGPPKRKIY